MSYNKQAYKSETSELEAALQNRYLDDLVREIKAQRKAGKQEFKLDPEAIKLAQETHKKTEVGMEGAFKLVITRINDTFWKGSPYNIALEVNGWCHNGHYTTSMTRITRSLFDTTTDEELATTNSPRCGDCLQHTHPDASRYHFTRDIGVGQEGEFMLVESQGRLKNISDLSRKIADRVFGLNTLISPAFRAISKGTPQVLDYAAVRLILEDSKRDSNIFRAREILYYTLGFKRWPGTKEKNYCDPPKPSGYRGFHLVLNVTGYPVEVQLRSQTAHEEAERGRASHREYKLAQEEVRRGLGAAEEAKHELLVLNIARIIDPVEYKRMRDHDKAVRDSGRK